MISRRNLLSFASAATVGVSLAACSSDADTVDSTSQGGGQAASDGDVFAGVEVQGAFGEEPTLTVHQSTSITQGHSKLLSMGEGERVESGRMIVTRSAYFDAQDGTMIASRWQHGTFAIFSVDEATVGPEAAAFLTSAHVGSRYIMAGVSQGQAVYEVGDIVTQARTRAEGVEREVSEQIPPITLGEQGDPMIPDGTVGSPVDHLIADTRILGDGPAAQQGSTLVVHYRGWNVETGEEFDASWSRGEPFDLILGTGQVIPGWDQGLEGMTEGSQVVLVIPPALGYGEDPAAHQLGGASLMFVVDILAVATP